jgi:hypothetical protein
VERACAFGRAPGSVRTAEWAGQAAKAAVRLVSGQAAEALRGCMFQLHVGLLGCGSRS